MLNIIKVKEIVHAWAIAAHPTEEQKYKAEIRLSVCMNCQFFSENPVKHCMVCKCPLSIKVFTPKEANACPKDKWPV